MSLISERILCGIALGVAITSTPVAAKDQPRVMLVLDGSSSMWARVEGDISKIEVARRAISDLVGGWESKMAFGVTAYGHRLEGSCQDIETVLPVADVDADEVIGVVNSILPRGKSPLAAALRQAAEGLDYENQPAKILLVSDGIENCGQDPCEMATQLVDRAKDLTIDIIAFDMNNHQMGKLECIATNASGHIVRAEYRDFKDAMDDSMTAVIEDEKLTAKLNLSVRSAGQRLRKDVRYVIYANNEDDRLTKYAESFSATPTLSLPAGTFVVEAILGDAEADFSHSIEVRLTAGAQIEHVFDVKSSEVAAR